MERERYDRQMRIEGWDQEVVQSSSVVVVGVGALGCELSKNLVMMGIGKLILVDNDYVELSNLSRQMLFRDEDIGRRKAETAAERLREMNKFVEIEHYDADVRTLPEEVFESVDVVCSCLDSWGVRRWLNSLCVTIRKPLVDGGLAGLYGNVQVVIPYKTPCLECHSESLMPREERLAECTLRRRRPGELVNDLAALGVKIDLAFAEELFKHNIKTIYDVKFTKLELLDGLNPSTKETILSIREALKPKIPNVQSVAATIAGFMTTEVLKMLHKGSIGPPAKGLIVYDAMYSRVSRVKLERKKGCIVCDDAAEAPIDVELPSSSTVRDLKEMIVERFSYPDVEIVYKGRKLSDDDALEGLGIRGGDVAYIITSRRYEPLAIRLLINGSALEGVKRIKPRGEEAITGDDVSGQADR